MLLLAKALYLQAENNVYHGQDKAWCKPRRQVQACLVSTLAVRIDFTVLSYKTIPVAVFMLLAGVAGATERYVARAGQTPASPYTSWSTASSNIQTVVNAADPGDTIWVGPGTYRRITGSQVVEITKHVKLRGAGDPATIVIDGNNQYRGISTSSSPVLDVDGFRFINGYDTWRGGGLRAASIASGSVVRNCIFENNSVGSSGQGAGVVSPQAGGFRSIEPRRRKERKGRIFIRRVKRRINDRHAATWAR